MAESNRTAYVFPGQGSQTVGMGRDLCQQFPEAQAVFDEADRVVGFPLSRLCFEGPEDELRQTINVQPAIVTISYALFQVARRQGLPDAAFVAGHSLGEYTALAAAGVIDFPTLVHLARERGRLMHEAGLKQPGGMVAVLGMDESSLEPICSETGTCMANINCQGQVVISGGTSGVAQAVAAVKSRGGRAIPLQVSGAFHSPLMQPAADGLARVVASLAFAPPRIPVIANTTARPLDNSDTIKEELLRQLCHCVRWQQSVEYMIANGVSQFIEIGPGKVLAGLVKRVSKDVRTVNIGDAGSAGSPGAAS